MYKYVETLYQHHTHWFYLNKCSHKMLFMYVVVVVIYLHLFEWWSTIPWFCLKKKIQKIKFEIIFWYYISQTDDDENSAFPRSFLWIWPYRICQKIQFQHSGTTTTTIIGHLKQNWQLSSLDEFFSQTNNQSILVPWRIWPQISKSRKLIHTNKFHIMKILNWKFGFFYTFLFLYMQCILNIK